MSNLKKPRHRWENLLILGMIWLLGAVCDRIWFALDHSIPAWDQADYLTGSLNYWRALQNPQWWDSEWWQGFWLLSSKIPPLTYIVTAVVQNIFGTGPDQATLVMLIFSAILLGSVYGLGAVLFSESVGLWAAALCQILPGLYKLRLDFLLDYPLAAVVTFSFFCLTVWQVRGQKADGRRQKVIYSLLWAAAFGLSLGLALMVKQTALFFLLTPIVWIGVAAIYRRRWGKLVQLLGALWLSVLVLAPWYSTNWLVILTSGKRATVDSAIAEGDAPLNTLAAWTYYWHQLPNQVSLLLLLVPIFALLIYWGRSLGDRKIKKLSVSSSWSLQWLAIFWVGAYLLSSLNPNKDDRYVLPYLPALTVFLAYGLTRFRSLWGQRVRWITVGLAVLLMFFNLFPVGGGVGNLVTQVLSPNARHYPHMEAELPHRQIIAEIIQTEPYLRSTLGVLPSTSTINQHNFNYYGALENFQVYGRQVGTREKFVEQDTRSLAWFLTKTGKQGSVSKAQVATVQTVEQGDNFQLHKSWNLPSGTILKLYHQRTPLIEVKPVSQKTQAKINLLQVTVPEKAPPGLPVPVTYTWNGSWEELKNGIVLLTWRNLNDKEEKESNSLWIHDHGIGMGTLYAGKKQPEGTLQITEKMAMLPPADLATGNYILEATYLNRVSGISYPISTPQITLQIDPQTAPTPAPELDLVTQIRNLAATLPQGTKALEQVFAEIGRINQYDPIQDYLIQAQLSAEYRFQNFYQNLDLAYTLALTNVLQQRVNGAIQALQQVTKLDAENPYAWAYLAFVQLYNWQPAAAENSLRPSLLKNPNLLEIQALNGITALMQGKIITAWQTFQKLKIMTQN